VTRGWGVESDSGRLMEADIEPSQPRGRTNWEIIRLRCAETEVSEFARDQDPGEQKDDADAAGPRPGRRHRSFAPNAQGRVRLAASMPPDRLRLRRCWPPAVCPRVPSRGPGVTALDQGDGDALDEFDHLACGDQGQRT
jgi:hypothetical protein